MISASSSSIRLSESSEQSEKVSFGHSFDQSAFLACVLADVRAKKDLAFLSTDFIIYHAGERLRLDKKLRAFVHSTELLKVVKSKKYDELIKFIRAKARNPYAIFQIPSLVAKRRELLSSARLADVKSIDVLLDSHLSTKERVPVYDEFFDLVFAKCADSRTELKTESKNESMAILDLACGLNPIAFHSYYNSHCAHTGKKIVRDITRGKMSFDKITYLCNELSDLDCQQLNVFFSRNKLSASAVSFDLVREFERLETEPFNTRFDICFLLKALDTLESQRLYVTYDILKRIDAALIVATFPIQSMSGKQMKRSAQIHWFEKMLPRLDMTFERQELGNEVIYFCRRNKTSKQESKQDK